MRTLKVFGILWLLLGASIMLYYVTRFVSGNLDLFSLVIVVFYSLLGVGAGLFLVARIPGRIVVAIGASMVYGIREFTYLFHTLPVPINPDSIRGFAVLFFALATAVVVIVERRRSRQVNIGL